MAGVGKTTAARILAAKVECSPTNMREIDGASNTGIDDMREVAKDLMYRAFGPSQIKVVIVDECHGLSRQAWQSLLKIVEEPPEHVYWVFCTTEAGKIPQTIKTRCITCQFQPVKTDAIMDLLLQVVANESFNTPESVLRVIARQSSGSVRQALSYLAQCYDCTDVKDAGATIQVADEEGDAIVLIRALVKGGLSWKKAMRLLDPIKDQSAESIRLVMLRYLQTIAMGSTSDDSAGRALELMDCFAEPYNYSEDKAPLLLSLGKIILGG